MYEIPNPKPSKAYIEAFNAAGNHIQSMSRRHNTELRWLKAVPYGPSLENISFFYGGQAYFVQLFDAEGIETFPGGTQDGLLRIAKGYKGFACYMPMHRGPGGWEPIYPGWGLVDAATGKPIDPLLLKTIEPVLVTDWELHDFAIQIVRDDLQKEGRTVLSWNSDPDIWPSLWFGNADSMEWIIVMEHRYPETAAVPSFDFDSAVVALRQRGYHGYYTDIGFSAHNQQVGEEPLALLRGQGAIINYKGLTSSE